MCGVCVWSTSTCVFTVVYVCAGGGLYLVHLSLFGLMATVGVMLVSLFDGGVVEPGVMLFGPTRPKCLLCRFKFGKRLCCAG